MSDGWRSQWQPGKESRGTLAFGPSTVEWAREFGRRPRESQATFQVEHAVVTIGAIDPFPSELWAGVPIHIGDRHCELKRRGRSIRRRGRHVTVQCGGSTAFDTWVDGGDIHIHRGHRVLWVGRYAGHLASDATPEEIATVVAIVATGVLDATSLFHFLRGL